MKHGTHALWAASSLVFLTTGCDDARLAGEFRDSELEIIRTQLGVLPETPAPSPSNMYADNPAAAALGKKYFWDAARLSSGPTAPVACSSCHAPQLGWQQFDVTGNVSNGAAGPLPLHPATVINVGYLSEKMGLTSDLDGEWMHWEGNADSLWMQAANAMDQLGAGRTQILYVIYDNYKEEHEAVFGPLPEMYDDEGVALYPPVGALGTPEWDELPEEIQLESTRVMTELGKAIAAFERTIISRNSRFDEFWEEIDGGAKTSDVLTPSEKRGLKLFIGKAACIECHRGPTLSDRKFHHIGLSQEGPNMIPTEFFFGRMAGQALVVADPYHAAFNCAGPFSDHPNKANCAVSTLSGTPGQETLGATLTKPLRNLTETGPYFHTGTYKTLHEVVEHYNKGGESSDCVFESELGTQACYQGTKDALMVELNLSTREVDDLVAFLETLTGEEVPASVAAAPTLP